MLFVSECTECSPQELSTASCSSQRDNTCTHIPPLVTCLNVALVLSCASTIIPSVLISNYALLAIYPVTVPNHANYNQYHDHVLLGHALINDVIKFTRLFHISFSCQRVHFERSEVTFHKCCLDPNFLARTWRS